MTRLAALLATVAALVAGTHPTAEALYEAESPGRAPQPVAVPLATAVAVPLATAIADGGVLHPPLICPAPDRGFNPLYRLAAYRHAPGMANALGCGVHALCEVESRQDPGAISPVGASGIAQFMPATARDLGIDPFDPEQAVDGAARYLVWLDRRFPHVSSADREAFVLAAYNWGVGHVRRSGCATWACLAPLLPRETRNYVARNEAVRTMGEWR